MFSLGLIVAVYLAIPVVNRGIVVKTILMADYLIVF